MNNPTLLREIKEFGDLALQENYPEKEVQDALNSIHKHFHTLSDISGFDTDINHLAAINTAKGKALGLNHAAQCLLDYKRTTYFVKAIILAIQEKLKSNMEKPVRVFYAGCGPYATLFTLVAPHFNAEEVQFTLLEINEKALKAAEKLIKTTGLDAYIEQRYTADACTFQIPKAEQYDILISETLDALLYRECYVPILQNLLPQLKNDLIVIPQNVSIELSLIKSGREQNHGQEEWVDEIFNVRKMIQAMGKAGNYPEKRIDLKKINISNYKHVIIDTRVHVHNTITLERYDSSLTLPYDAELEHPITSDALVFNYVTSPNIELKLHFADN